MITWAIILATARAIAQETGLLHGKEEMLTGMEIGEFDDNELGKRLEHTTVIARATPLDKLRVIECLRQKGHISRYDRRWRQRCSCVVSCGCRSSNGSG